MNAVCFNGRFLPGDQPLFTSANRGFRYGDGLFETMKVVNGGLPLGYLHWERLFSGLRLLQIKPGFTPEELEGNAIELCCRNNLLAARVRLSVYREGEGCAYLIEASPIEPASYQWKDEGLTIGIYPFARKSQDAFANLKSANYLAYVLAERYAGEQGWGEALVLNGQSNISDASKANLFLLKKGALYTPAPHQGCVLGVMRRFLIEEAKNVQ
jgi:branched-chain amino acid aminotransferase